MNITAYIALGSNQKDPIKQVKTAFDFLSALPETHVVAFSSLYETAPVGPQDQPHFINQVIALKTTLSARELLQALQSIENKMGRVRDGVCWGPRVIDCDILLYGNAVIKVDDLVVPHPEMTKRAFVMVPLTEIAGDIKMPSGKTVRALCDVCSIQGVKKLEGE